MRFLFIFPILFTLFSTGLTGTIYTPVVDTTSGRLYGKFIKTVRRSIDAAEYSGIPYGEPPVGNLRFKPPVEKKRSNKILNATDDTNVCVQPTMSGIIGSEDCLYLNVYVPWIRSTHPKPVMFWIHGGSFTQSHLRVSSSFKPDFLLEEDVIVVSANYRLGPLGFLNFHHENATGNAGLKDQLLALKWVKKNIRKFGGDPDRVTIFGQSAGGVSVDYHVLSESSAGLFNQAISMSGSPLNLYWGLQSSQEAENAALQLGSVIKETADKELTRVVESRNLTNDKDLLMQYLITAPAYNIIKIASQFPMMAFRVTIEQKFENQDAFVSGCSLKKYLSGNYNKVPYMTGYTSNEAKMFFQDKNIPINLAVKYGSDSLKVAKVPVDIPIFDQFLANAPLSYQKYDQLVKTFSDLFFVTGIDMKQQLMQLNNGYPIYYYRFSFVGPSDDQGIAGVGHEGELSYLFYIRDNSDQMKDIETATTVARYVRLMTNFAKYGNPTPPEIQDPLLRITWPKSNTDGYHLEIDSYLSVGFRPINNQVRTFELAGAATSALLNEC